MPAKMSVHDRPFNEKAEVAQDESGHPNEVSVRQGRHHGHHNKTEDEIERIDALALAEGTTLDSFKHLDEKKILRKMDLRLIPVLALLYLLSFLDRGSTLYLLCSVFKPIVLTDFRGKYWERQD